MSTSHSILARQVATHSLATRRSHRKASIKTNGAAFAMAGLVTTASILGAFPAIFIPIILAPFNIVSMPLLGKKFYAKNENNLSLVRSSLQELNSQPPNSSLNQQSTNDLTDSLKESLHHLTKSKNYGYASAILKTYRDLVPQENRANLLSGLKKRHRKKLAQTYGYEELTNGFSWLRPQGNRSR